MHFLWAKITFYYAINMIHDVVRTANPFPYTAKFMFVMLQIIKLNKPDVER